MLGNLNLENDDQGRAGRVKRRIPYDIAGAGRTAEDEEPGEDEAGELQAPGRL
jgi:hypothetical protein